MSHASQDEIRLHPSPFVRGLLIALGTLFVAIGVVGIFLPLLPTTVWLLLAAACYARGSERFYGWLLANRICGPLIREWREHRSIRRGAKITALSVIVLSFTTTTLFFIPSLAFRIGFVILGMVVFLIVWRLPVRPPQPDLASQAAGASPRGR